MDDEKYVKARVIATNNIHYVRKLDNESDTYITNHDMRYNVKELEFIK